MFYFLFADTVPTIQVGISSKVIHQICINLFTLEKN